MVEFFSAPNESNGSILKYKKENGTYYRIDTYFNGMFVVFYDNVPEKLYKQFERIMNSVKIIKMCCHSCNQIITGLPHIDYGARMYDPYAARWNATDPMAVKYPSTGPYVFCADNPVIFIDPDGNSWYYNSETGDFITHIEDDDDHIYVITTEQSNAAAGDGEKLKKYRDDKTMLGHALEDKTISDNAAVSIFRDLLDKANRTSENGNIRISKDNYKIFLGGLENENAYAETKQVVLVLRINPIANWYMGYDSMVILAHEIGHMIDKVNLPTYRDERRAAAAERFADETAMSHWSFQKASERVKKYMVSHYLKVGGKL